MKDLAEILLQDGVRDVDLINTLSPRLTGALTARTKFLTALNAKAILLMIRQLSLASIHNQDILQMEQILF